MSGDVFGNGMLLSKQIRLVAAFDHRHIFLDPNPQVAASLRERERLFALPRSSWDDYSRKLISRGGGVWPRTAKSIPLGPEARTLLGFDAAAATPVEVMRADGREIRAKVLGEGGNLGCTQRGRVEYAQSGGPERSGGRINTDFIDNS